MRKLLPILLTLFSTTEGWSLPPCGASGIWTNCFGTETFGKHSKWEGDKYVGEYKDGKPHGQGAKTFSNGDKYVGEFKDREKNGQGTVTRSDGRKYVGEWEDDEFHGQGTATSPDGSKYVGEYKDNKRHGRGAYTFSDGRVLEGIWENDKFLYAQKVPRTRDSGISINKAKSECEELGFEPKTEKFAECVLKLTN